MQSIAAVCCELWLVAPSPWVWPQACCPVRPKLRRSRCRKTPERAPEISSRKRRPIADGRQDDLPIDRLRIVHGRLTGIAAGVVGSAGGTVAAAIAAGDGYDGIRGRLRPELRRMT